VWRRLLGVALLGSSLALTPSAQAAFGAPVLGPQRVLVVMVTWGPEPFTQDEARHVVFDQADAFYRLSSYGKASITGTVTPWLHALAAAPGCSTSFLIALRTAASAAAAAAGYDLGAYDRVIFLHPDAGCPWSGVTYAATIFLNGALTRRLVAHELGHSFGLAHANTTSCRRHGCGAVEYGDPYDTMGEGTGDFSAKAKFTLGWLTKIPRASVSRVYTLNPLERPAAGGQALSVTTANDEYWIEYRSEPARDEARKLLAGPGVVVHVSPSPDVRGPGSSTLGNVLLDDPAGRKRPELRPGDRFSDPGAFTLTVLKQAGSRARLRFKWTDAVAPRVPQLLTEVVGGSLQLTVGSPHDTGSGVVRYSVTLDGRTALRLGTDETDEPVRVGRPLPGTHTLSVVAIDRAGNRSLAATRRIRIP
jgi:hypothetical protein